MYRDLIHPVPQYSFKRIRSNILAVTIAEELRYLPKSEHKSAEHIALRLAALTLLVPSLFTRLRTKR